jgi:hypothetical protein
MNNKAEIDVEELLRKIPEKRKTDLVAVGISLASAIAGITILLAAPADHKIDIFLAFMVVPISYILYEQWQQPAHYLDMKIQIALLRRQCDELFQNAHALGVYTTKLEKLNTLDSTLHATGLSVLDQALENVWFSVKGEAILVRGREMSTLSYEKFWEQLVKNLPSRRPYFQNRPVAKITHAGDIGYWYNQQSDHINSLHSKFKADGSVFRIFIDTIPLRILTGTREPAEKLRVRNYRNLMRKMQDLGVNCLYLNAALTEKEVRLHVAHDFCLVSEFFILPNGRFRTMVIQKGK